MYDDDDDGDDESKFETEDTQKPSEDPFLSLKEAFTTGQEAFKLFYFEENQDEKFEVCISLVEVLVMNRFTSFSAGYL